MAVLLTISRCRCETSMLRTFSPAYTVKVILEEENHGRYIFLLCIYACVFVTHYAYIVAKQFHLDTLFAEMTPYYGSSCDLMPPYNFFHL